MLLTGFDPLLIKRRYKRWIIEHLLLNTAQSGNQAQILGQRMPLGQVLQPISAQRKQIRRRQMQKRR